jgi:hypothetical protein
MRGSEAVYDPRYQRPFGTDDGERDVLPLCEREQGVDIIRRYIDIAGIRFECSAGIAGRDKHVPYLRRLRALPCKGVFASAAAHNQYLRRLGHVSDENAASR